jgi:protein TonB
MISLALQDPAGAPLGELSKLADPGRDRIAIAVLVALGAHLGFALWAPDSAAVRAPPPAPVEVEFAPPPPPPPPEAAKPEPPAPSPAPRPAAPKVNLAPPPAARAGAVRTVEPAPQDPTPSEPFDFTSDPRSASFASGVVAVGGTGDHGLAGAQLGGRGTEARHEPPHGDGLTAASDLSQTPKLRVADPCRGFFPSAAHDDVATAVVRLVVTPSGGVTSASVLSETPSGQGFGAAARACMLEQKLNPALDRQGRPAATAVNVNVRFSR